MLKEIKELGNKKIMDVMKDTVSKQNAEIIRATSRVRIAEGLGVAGLVFGVGALIIATTRENECNEMKEILKNHKAGIDELYAAYDNLQSFGYSDPKTTDSCNDDEKQEG